MVIKNKKILITAGPTWVPIDKVRVISNTATGETGILLSQRLTDLGAKVTLILGPAEVCCLDKKIKLIRFNFFNELKNLIEMELRSKRYDIVIHSAAVSDYRPAKIYNKKIKSGLGTLQLRLVPTLKIIDSIKKISPDSFAVGFKFEPLVQRKELINKAKALMRRAGLDLVVANSIKNKRYSAYILKNTGTCGPLLTKKQMAAKLINLIGG